MGFLKLYVAPIGNMSAIERAESISVELCRVSKPVRGDNVVKEVFGYAKHKSEDKAVLMVDLNHKIVVDPLNNLAKLISLMPAMTSEEISDKVSKIKPNATLLFGDLVPKNSTYISDVDFETNWI